MDDDEILESYDCLEDVFDELLDRNETVESRPNGRDSVGRCFDCGLTVWLGQTHQCRG